MCPDSEAISALRRGARCLRNRMLAPSSKRNRRTCSTCRRSEAENGGLRFPCLSAAWCSLSAHQAGCGDASLIVGVGAYLCLYGPNREHRVGEIMATVTQAYRFALDPTPIQRRALASHCGAPGSPTIGVWRWSRPASTSAEPTWGAGAMDAACPSCGGNGTGRRTRLPRGGPRTPRRPTPPGWMD
jgi:hypothetical protein